MREFLFYVWTFVLCLTLFSCLVFSFISSSSVFFFLFFSAPLFFFSPTTTQLATRCSLLSALSLFSLPGRRRRETREAEGQLLEESARAFGWTNIQSPLFFFFFFFFFVETLFLS